MFEKIIAYSLKYKFLVILLTLGIFGGGIYSLMNISVNAVPDITNNQVQVVTTSQHLAAEETEKYVTLPLELAFKNLPSVEEIRSISRFGLSVITIVFDEELPTMTARQYVSEVLSTIGNEIPNDYGTPSMMPITTGLGEVFQYVLSVDEGYQYSLTELRTLQDWVVKRQLSGTEGIVEVSTFGGFLKEYEISIDPQKLIKSGVQIEDIEKALISNNANSGGGYISTPVSAYYLRTQGRAESINDLKNIVVKSDNKQVVRVSDVAEVKIGHPLRFGALTMDGKGEVVGGITLMLKGENSYKTILNVQERIQKIQTSLPEGVHIFPYLDRSVLIGKTTQTVITNLVEGGIIVFLVLLLFLGSFRAGLIVASIIPLSLMFALIMMHLFGISANLMSLGAIDFGIVVDGGVIIVEGIMFYLIQRFKPGEQIDKGQMHKTVLDASTDVYKKAAFGILIILVVFTPIYSLEGVERKTFLPMVLTLSFAIFGSLILSLTFIPVISELFIRKRIPKGENFSDRMINVLQKIYSPMLKVSLRRPFVVILGAIVIFLASIGLFSKMGSEFVPTLEEGDLAMQLTLPPGGSLEYSIETTTKIEKILLDQFPEIEHIVSKIGTSEVPTDPMSIEQADIMILLKSKEDWTTTQSTDGLIKKMKVALQDVENAEIEFSQPIQLRFNELMTGVKSDIAIQLFGEDTKILKEKADEIEQIINDIEGVDDVVVEQTEGLKQLKIEILRNKLSIYDVSVADVNKVIRSAYAGLKAGTIYELEKSFDIVIRINEEAKESFSPNQLYVTSGSGSSVPLSQLVKIEEIESPLQITRENAQRKINIGVNARGRDIGSVVSDIQLKIKKSGLQLPTGYMIEYGGQYENLQRATNRLILVVPIALILVFLLLYIGLNNLVNALIIFITVPLAVVGGIILLWMRDMPFSISAGIGFIALFGIAVLNGIVLIQKFSDLNDDPENNEPLITNIMLGARQRLRPVLMTAITTILGFLPMAISTSNGAEVQRPLATVVMGGLFTSTLLTLVVLPSIYYLIKRKRNDA